MKSAVFDLLWLFPEINSVLAIYQLITSASTIAMLLVTELSILHFMFLTFVQNSNAWKNSFQPRPGVKALQDG